MRRRTEVYSSALLGQTPRLGPGALVSGDSAGACIGLVGQAGPGISIGIDKPLACGVDECGERGVHQDPDADEQRALVELERRPV